MGPFRLAHRLAGNRIGLRYLAVDLRHGGGELVCCRRDVAHIAGSVGRGRGCPGGPHRGVIGRPGEAPRGCKHLIGYTAELRQGGLDFGSEAADLERDVLLAARTRVGVIQDRPAQLLVLAHGILEDAYRAGERADLVVPLAERNSALHISRRHGFRDTGDCRERARNSAPDDHRSKRRQHHRQGRGYPGEPGHPADVVVDLRVDALRARGVKLAKLGEVLIERLAHAAVGIIVAPFAAGRRTDLDPAAHQLAPKLLELADAP